MKMKPKVSVVMPSLNVASYVRECMDSVVNQTLKEIEILCVDAGSTDGTWEILQKYAEKDSRIHLIHSEKKSYGYQMNLGLDAAQGEYIGIVETDDYIKLDMYEVLYRTAHQNDLDFVKSDSYRFVDDERTNKRKFERLSLSNDKKIYYKKLNPSQTPALLRLTMNNVTGIYRRMLIREHNIRLNESPGAAFQDNGLWFQLFSLSQSAMFIDRAFYCIRRDNPNSSVHNKEKVYCMCDEYDYILKFLEKDNERLKKFFPYFVVKKYDNYLFTYNRIGDEFKLEFLQRFSREFNEYKAKGLLCEDVFTKNKLNTLSVILECPEQYYYTHSNGINVDLHPEQNSSLEKRLKRALYMQKRAEQEILLIHRSASYRIGRFITFVPRMLRKIYHCTKENGLSYTIKKCVQKLSIAR